MSGGRAFSPVCDGPSLIDNLYQSWRPKIIVECSLGMLQPTHCEVGHQCRSLLNSHLLSLPLLNIHGHILSMLLSNFVHFQIEYHYKGISLQDAATWTLQTLQMDLQRKGPSHCCITRNSILQAWGLQPHGKLRYQQLTSLRAIIEPRQNKRTALLHICISSSRCRRSAAELDAQGACRCSFATLQDAVHMRACGQLSHDPHGPMCGSIVQVVTFSTSLSPALHAMFCGTILRLAHGHNFIGVPFSIIL